MEFTREGENRRLEGGLPKDPFGVLREQIGDALRSVLTRCIPDCTEYALLDFPNHSNVGDSAIWLGEFEYLLTSLKTAPCYTCHLGAFSPRELRRVLNNGPVFLHGGGNLGDWYPRHQEFREFVISEFQDYPIIQLPQTVNFRERRNLERFKQVVGRHKNFTMLVRDKRSYELATKNLDCRVYLCPDMAFALRSLRRKPARIDCLWLLRTDQESELLDRNLEGFLETLKLDTSLRRHKTVDWLLPRRGPWQRMHDKWDRILSKSPAVVQRASLLSRSYIYGYMARRRVKRGAKLLCTGRYVVTDRLHGHILCVLLGIPHVCVDNSYGKIGSFFETWSESCPQAAYAESIETAIEKLRILSST